MAVSTDHVPTDGLRQFCADTAPIRIALKGQQGTASRDDLVFAMKDSFRTDPFIASLFERKYPVNAAQPPAKPLTVEKAAIPSAVPVAKSSAKPLTVESATFPSLDSVDDATLLAFGNQTIWRFSKKPEGSVNRSILEMCVNGYLDVKPSARAEFQRFAAGRFKSGSSTISAKSPAKPLAVEKAAIPSATVSVASVPVAKPTTQEPTKRPARTPQSQAPAESRAARALRLSGQSPKAEAPKAPADPIHLAPAGSRADRAFALAGKPRRKERST